MQTIFNTLNMPIRMSFTAVVLAVAIAAASVVLEVGIINGSQAQIGQTPSARLSPPPSPSPSTSPPPSPTNTTISPQEKSKLCDPNNPKLRFVNTTESKICGLPITIKNVTTTTPTPTTSIPPPTPKPISPSSPNPITPPPSENPPQEAPIPGLP
jgi:hypothetical protein